MADYHSCEIADGSVRDVPARDLRLDIARSISPRLSDAALAAQIKPLSPNGGGNGHHAVANEASVAAPASAHAPAAKDGSH